MASKLTETRRIFEISEDSPSDPLAKRPTKKQMDWACRVPVGLDHLVEDFDLDGLAYYYRGLDGNLYERLGAGMILGTPDGARPSLLGRSRPEELPGDEGPGLDGRGRQLHGAIRPGLS